jgi:excisionase family DNA binding protein
MTSQMMLQVRSYLHPDAMNPAPTHQVALRCGLSRTNAEPGAEKLIDCTEVAKLLGVTLRHVRRLVAERRIPFVKIGSFVRFDPADVRAYVLSCKVAAATGPVHDLRGR